MTKENTSKPRKYKFIWLLLIGIGFFAVLFAATQAHTIFYAPNVNLPNNKSFSLEIKTNSQWQDVEKLFIGNQLLSNQNDFNRVAKLLKYTNSIKPGCYLIKSGMNNLELVRKLRSGNQDAIKLTFNNARTKEDLAGKIAKQLEFDSISLLQLMNNTAVASKYEATPQSMVAIFIPNTYNVFWNISPQSFLNRMYKEYQSFWNANRENKRKQLSFSRLEVSTLASIVEKETNKNDEKQDVAGVYINRLNIGMLLQADPTLVFASGDFGLKRVLDIHKKIDSPYNTYMYKGLPPAPICVPSISSIDAVLNHHKHEFLFFCAREDFSGYHNFAKTHNQHIKNSHRYQKALDKMGIR